MATLATPVRTEVRKNPRRTTIAYSALLIFTCLYYARPEDFVPGISAVPVEKIVGGVALVALAAGLLSGRAKRKVPLELKLLLLLLLHLIITIPFAFWRGGAFATVFDKFAKGVIVGLLVTLVAENFDQLRKLLFVQAASMWVTTIASLILHRTDKGRLMGALGGIFENPNDLAINISINWPLCLAFLLASRAAIRKGFWATGLLAMLWAVVLTYSRSGLLAMVMALAICLWEFGIRGRRVYLLVFAGVLVVAGAAVVVATPHYFQRMESIIGGNMEGSDDRGTWEARRQLLVDSVKMAIHHPLLGIGPGNFPAVTRTWRVTHNTYSEFAAEAGFPAMILFLAILFLAFRNLRRVRKLPGFAEDPEIRLFTSALWASLAAYVIGAFFSSTEYNLFPYYMVAYTSVIYRIAASSQGNNGSIQSRNERSGDRIRAR
jgi:O-antigen ligase